MTWNSHPMTTERLQRRSKKPARDAEPITVYVPAELHRRLEAMARRESRTLPRQCLILLRKGVSNRATSEPFAGKKV